MSRYLRPRLPGASVFFTVCAGRRGVWDLVTHIDLLREAVRKTRSERPFTVDAWVVLPDHLHCVWTLPEGDSDYENRWRIIKARVSTRVPAGPRRPSQMRRGEHGFWQRRYWEHHLRGPGAKARAIRYCWNNPVKHGLVDTPAAWEFSSWHRDHPGIENLTERCT